MTLLSPQEDHLRRLVTVPANGVQLEGMLVVPERAKGIVLFAHGSGSGRHSPRNNFVAQTLNDVGYGTLLMDLLTWRLERATQWIMEQPHCSALQIAFFGASTGAAAALNAAATLGSAIGAVVSRGGRPDLAMEALANVQSPTLLIVGALDDVVIELNRRAYEKLQAKKHLAIVKGATHLFEEPGTLQEVAHMATAWFKRHLGY